MAAQGGVEVYDRLKEVKIFDDSNIIIPTIDLSSSNGVNRPRVVDEVAKAAHEFGFFQVINHGIHVDVMNRLIGALRRFHEQPTEIKAQYYGREKGQAVEFKSNLNFFRSKGTYWSDLLRIILTPTLPELGDIPATCRSEIVEWDTQIKQLGDTLTELLCEGLDGVAKGKLKCWGRTMVNHHYPYCPDSDQMVGLGSHTDAGLLAILLQDHIGGLQVKHNDKWLDVKPIPGALVINIGDMLQIMSNDEYKSGEHRVLANRSPEPRISAAVFFSIGEEDIIGPLPELISQDKPAVYRQFGSKDYMTRFYTNDLDGKTLKNYFKL